MKNAKAKLKEIDLSLHSLVKFTELISFAKDCGKISESELELLLSWQQNPEKWSAERC